MKITILGFYPEKHNFREGFVDFRVDHSPEKMEIFRGVSYSVKENKKWLSVGVVKRNEKWLPKYDRNPPMTTLLQEALTALDEYIKAQPIEKPFIKYEASIFDEAKLE